ncbi:MAG: ATP-binding protein [Candidatus Omnitrophota bacterium]|nr:ATP-binding protein [Candidatus Omnitrophota bacterium]
MYFVYVAIVFVIAVGTALGVIFMADRSARSGGKIRGYGGRGPQMEGSPTDGAFADANLKQVIFNAVNTISNSGEAAEEAANTISDIFAKELEKKVALNKQELHKQYNSIIEQKDQSEKAAWEKYNKVASDKKDTEAVIRSIAEGLVVVDAKGNVIMMNPTAEKLLGVSRENKAGRSILEDLKKEQLISMTSRSSQGEDREIEISSKDDETKKILRSSSAVIENENGQTVGMVSVLSDVTKQKELDQAKSDFVSKISHEFRTPIITIQNSVVLLLGETLGPITKKQEEFLNIAKRSLDRLALLIEDLLDMSKIEASKIELKITPCSVEKLIKDSCDALNAWAMTKAIEIKIDIQKDIPLIPMDYNRMIQVINNIVGNAVKFTPRSGLITIKSGLTQDGRNVFVSVTDTGAGISRGELEKIFEKFHQASDRALADISGTGLGLAIAREIVLMHKGKIWAESDEGQGAKLSFTLPITTAQ